MNELTVTTVMQLGLKAFEIGDFEESERCFNAILKVQPKHADANHNIGILHVKVGKHACALPFFQTAIEKNPSIDQYWMSYIDCLLNSGQFELADEVFDDFKKNVNENFIQHKYRFLIIKGVALQSRYKYREAESVFKKAIKIDYAQPNARIHLSSLYLSVESPLKALETLNTARIQCKENVEIYVNAIETCEKYNMLEQAQIWLKLAYEQFKILPLNLKFCEIALQYRNFEYEKVDKSLTYNFISQLDEARQLISFELLAKSNDFLGRPKKAANSFSNMNSIMRECYKRNGYLNDNFLERCEAKASRLTEISKVDKKPPIKTANKLEFSFLVGFPRSGSTLISKVLDAHPMVECIEEFPLLTNVLNEVKLNTEDRSSIMISDKNISSLKQGYVKKVQQNFLSSTDKIVIDKRPLNILEIPAISQVFPSAEILCLLRHPCDAILSCWMQNFKMSSAMKVTTDIDELVKFYCYAMEIVTQSQRLFKTNITFLKYEEFIRAPNTSLKIYLKKLELKWVAEMENYREKIKNSKRISTPSYAQVVQPIYYNSINRWENYHELLRPFSKDINPWIERLGYDNTV